MASGDDWRDLAKFMLVLAAVVGSLLVAALIVTAVSW